MRLRALRLDPAIVEQYLAARQRFGAPAASFAGTASYLNNLAEEAAEFRRIFGAVKWWKTATYREIARIERLVNPANRAVALWGAVDARERHGSTSVQLVAG